MLGGVFRPHVAFATHDLAFVSLRLNRHRVEGIHLRQIRGPQRIVQIAMACRRHNGICAQMRRLNGARHPPPALHHRPFRQPAFEDFIPSHDALAALGEVLTHFIDEGRLELRFVFQSQTVHLSLALGALGPSNLGDLIPTNVDDVRREHLTHFVKHSFDKGHGGVVSRTIHVLEHPPIRGHRKGISCATEPRVGRQCRSTMSGHFNFGNDLHVAIGGVRHDVCNVLSGVMSPRDLTIVFRSPCPDFREFGIRFNGQPPPLILRQMPVQDVHFLQRHDLDELLDERGLHEVPATVQKQPSVAQLGMVLNPQCRQGETCWAMVLANGWHDLPERRPAPESPLLAMGRDGCPVLLHRQHIAFLSQVFSNHGPNPIGLSFLSPFPADARLVQPLGGGRQVPSFRPRQRQRAVASHPFATRL